VPRSSISDNSEPDHPEGAGKVRRTTRSLPSVDGRLDRTPAGCCPPLTDSIGKNQVMGDIQLCDGAA
jgi:hypothetical protein